MIGLDLLAVEGSDFSVIRKDVCLESGVRGGKSSGTFMDFFFKSNEVLIHRFDVNLKESVLLINVNDGCTEGNFGIEIGFLIDNVSLEGTSFDVSQEGGYIGSLVCLEGTSLDVGQEVSNLAG